VRSHCQVASSLPGGGHAADQAGGNGGALGAVEAQIGKNPIEPEPAEGGEANRRHANRAGPDELQRVDIDLGKSCCWRGGGCGGADGDQAGGIALRQGLDGLGLGEQVGLAGLASEQGVDAGTQARPVGLRQVEMAAEIEQGDLTHLLANALGGDQAMGEVRFVSGFVPGCCPADEHAARVGRTAASRQ
jgi:hypothetical protein